MNESRRVTSFSIARSLHPMTFAASQSDYYTWDEYNVEFLKRRFTTSEPADECAYGGVGVIGGYASFAEKVDEYGRDVSKKLRRLESHKQRIDSLMTPHISKPADRRDHREVR